MGGTNYSASDYDDRARDRAARGSSGFDYHDKITSGKAVAACHDALNPKGATRECRDSTVHPEAVPIIVLLDVTGSMSEVPKIVQRNLPKLMSLLIRRGYVDHPAILVGAIGDCHGDAAPLQVGQFESGIEIDNDITRLYLEGGGGGSNHESYELALYWVARHTVSDHWEKRQKRGYLFVVGDELPYDPVDRRDVHRIIGDTIEANVPTADIVAEVQRRYETFYVLPNMTSGFNDDSVRSRWRGLLGQNFLLLNQPEAICELIATQIGVGEGRVTTDAAVDDLVAEGTSRSAAHDIVRAVRPGSGLAANIPDSGAGTGLVTF